MKKIILLLSVILCANMLFAQQNLKQHFSSELIKYTKAFNQKDWDKVAEMVYPKIFTRISKENLITIAEGMDSMGLTMKTNFKHITKVSKIVTYGNEKYCKIGYFGIVTIKLSFLMSQTYSMWQDQFNKEFGKENVEYNSDKSMFTIKANRSMLAISPKNTIGWKFLDIDSPKAKGLRSLVPLKVRQDLAVGF